KPCFPAYCLPDRRTRAASSSFPTRYDFVTPLPHRAGRIDNRLVYVSRPPREPLAPHSGCHAFADSLQSMEECNITAKACEVAKRACFRGDVPWRTILQKTAKAWHPRPAHYLETDHVASRVRNVKQAKRKRIFMPRARIVVVE